jgi:hypothetical protein
MATAVDIEALLDGYESFRIDTAKPMTGSAQPSCSGLFSLEYMKLQAESIKLGQEMCRRMKDARITCAMDMKHRCTYDCHFVSNDSYTVFRCILGPSHLCTMATCDQKRPTGQGTWVCQLTSNTWLDIGEMGAQARDSSDCMELVAVDRALSSAEGGGYGDASKADDDEVDLHGASFNRESRKRKAIVYIPENKEIKKARMEAERSEHERLVSLVTTGNVATLIDEMKEEKAEKMVKSKEQSLRMAGLKDGCTVSRSEPRTLRIARVKRARVEAAKKLEAKMASNAPPPPPAAAVTTTTMVVTPEGKLTSPPRNRRHRKSPPNNRIRADDPTQQLAVARSELRKILQLRPGEMSCCGSDYHLDKIAVYCCRTWNTISLTSKFQEFARSSGLKGEKAWYPLKHHCVVVLDIARYGSEDMKDFVPFIGCAQRRFDIDYVDRLYFGYTSKQEPRGFKRKKKQMSKMRTLGMRFKDCVEHIPIHEITLPDISCVCSLCTTPL